MNEAQECPGCGARRTGSGITHKDFTCPVLSTERWERIVTRPTRREQAALRRWGRGER